MNPNIRSQFPILNYVQNDHPLVYLDNTATTQKPQRVIDAMTNFITHENATVHRGIYGLSQKATEQCDRIREDIASFINAKQPEEIIFTKGTTESINLVAHSYASQHLKAGQGILITEMEHHANIVPWQEVCKKNNLQLFVAPINDAGELEIDAFKEIMASNAIGLVGITHISNVLGTINPIKEIIDLAHSHNAKVLIDGAQSIAHTAIDVQALDCDFFCFSSHKMYGPTGIGVLYGKYDLLDQMTPYQTGGDMIEFVTFEETTFAKPPAKFEAGTPAIIETIGLGETITFLKETNLQTIADHEHRLLEVATEKLSAIDGLKIIGTAQNKAAIISFVIDHVHPHDAGTILDTKGIAVRVGHHCAQPLMKRFDVPATIRASFSVYNTEEEIDKLVDGIHYVKDILT